MATLREVIMSNCPEEFEAELEGFIDIVESRIYKAVELLGITGLHDLNNIVKAYKVLNDLNDRLY